jgi:hypothetical protein
MEDDTPPQKPESLLPYEDWTADALRHVVVAAIRHAAANGLPGEHHFYLTFRTDDPRTAIPARLKAQYPTEMTIVLQHQFWDLGYDDSSGLISVGLSFGGVPATLVIPLDAVTAFADPHVGYGLRFRYVEPTAAAPEPEPAPPPAEAPQVVSLDAFRRRTPPKE